MILLARIRSFSAHCSLLQWDLNEILHYKHKETIQPKSEARRVVSGRHGPQGCGPAPTGRLLHSHALLLSETGNDSIIAWTCIGNAHTKTKLGDASPRLERNALQATQRIVLADCYRKETVASTTIGFRNELQVRSRFPKKINKFWYFHSTWIAFQKLEMPISQRPKARTMSRSRSSPPELQSIIPPNRDWSSSYSV